MDIKSDDNNNDGTEDKKEIATDKPTNVHTIDKKQLSDLGLQELLELNKSIKETEYFLETVRGSGFTKAIVIGVTEKGIVPLSNIDSISDINLLLDITKAQLVENVGNNG